jgi:DeoR family fructose operon transcriptional repressor
MPAGPSRATGLCTSLCSVTSTTNTDGHVHSRRESILARARDLGRLNVAETALALDISAETLRRDLRSLETEGLVRRSYGTVYPVESGRYETSLFARESMNSAEKQRVAASAVEQLGEAQTVFIDEGSLPQLVAFALPKTRQLTVLSTSLPVAAALAAEGVHEVILIGGRVRGNTLGVVDHWAADMLASFVIDVGFIGANGVSVTHGFTTPDPSVAAVKRAAVEVCSRKVFVGAHTKFGVSSFARFASLSEFDLLITGHQLPAHQAARYAAFGARMLRV